MSSYDGLLEIIKNQNQQIDWDRTSVLMENTLDGTFLDGEEVTRDDYFMLVNADGQINYMESKGFQYTPMFILDFMHEDKIVKVFGWTKGEIR